MSGSLTPSLDERSTRAGLIAGTKPRGLSFKRRRPSGGKANFLQRASMGVFSNGRDRKPSTAASDVSKWKSMRRAQTLSAHPVASGDADGEGGASSWSGIPSIPRMLPMAKASPYSTPIPTLPFVVLCLVVFGEFSSAGVAGPFLFFMIDDFGVGGESEVGFWAGIVSSVFFFAQFLTSLLWASVAEKRGRRFVLMVSLVGNAASLVLFGMATNLPTAIMIRLAQGLFNGAVGVAKGAIRDITDETNEGRAYAQMGFCWGMGGIIGPILGGVLEHAATKYPSVFGQYELLKTYPYLLPCMVGASFTALGAFLSLFIGYDGGPRTGSIQLPEKADIERATSQAASNMGSIGRNASKRISGYFSNVRASFSNAGESALSLSRTNTQQMSPSRETSEHAGKGLDRTFTQQVDYETGGPPSPAESDGTIVTRTNMTNGDSAFERVSMYGRSPYAGSRTTERQRNILGGGSAYGYDRRMSRTSTAPNQTSGQMSSSFMSGTQAQSQVRDRNARLSFTSNNQYAPDFEEIGSRPGLSFAQRFLLSHDDAVFSISDLWVAAAINGDDAYSAMDEDVFEEDDEEQEEGLESLDEEEVGDESGSITGDSTGARAFGYDDEGPSEDSPLLRPRHLPPVNFVQRKMSRGARSDANSAFSGRSRNRTSFSGGYGGGRIPSLYANTGMESPLLSPGLNVNPISSGLSLAGSTGGLAPPSQRPEGAWDPTLAGIPESHSQRNSLHTGHPQRIGSEVSPDRRSTAMLSAAGTEDKGLTVSSSSLIALLPTVIIAHYGLMAFHSATFDQIFMAFLVTPEVSGGLGLTASHYAQLISAMACCQLVFQFVFYPKVGPPQGKLSHLAMLRLGTAIYLPCYTLFPLLRSMLHPETDALVMSGMILFASMRWLANICAFTAVSVLINAMTPPHLTPLANGLAQTTSSAARFVGPIIGGMVWAKGIDGGPDAHSWPFNYHLGFWFVGLVGFTGFLFSWKIR
ncbi:major facilitator superfamily MFS-1 [Violaceomyces palustris]|uniref:Major facilitator superfamily MFS-1 n=1 Tax=Violaceomyces palustris TaxID=1673888 RepID=A0ACD0P712_9BASI|nr:major facilitator superfamily MFS-1 [Violaceomyces palustris]